MSGAAILIQYEDQQPCASCSVVGQTGEFILHLTDQRLYFKMLACGGDMVIFLGRSIQYQNTACLGMKKSDFTLKLLRDRARLKVGEILEVNC